MNGVGWARHSRYNCYLYQTVTSFCNTTQKKLHIRITERRMHKLQLLAVEKDKTMTQLIEELIDLSKNTQT